MLQSALFRIKNRMAINMLKTFISIFFRIIDNEGK